MAMVKLKEEWKYKKLNEFEELKHDAKIQKKIVKELKKIRKCDKCLKLLIIK